MYFEASGTPADTRAILESPTVAGGTGCSMSLWYHMYGANGGGIGTLYMYQYNPATGALQLLWSKTGNQVLHINHVFPLFSICDQHCSTLCRIISAAQRNKAKHDSNEE